MSKTLYSQLSNTLLEHLTDKGKITVKTHPKYSNLKLFKYSAGYNFFDEKDEDVKWVELCRGLVWDSSTEKIVANPMPKFYNHFNYSDRELEYLFKNYEYAIENKLDGSCVLLWNYQGEWHWSTLGSFQSEQAKRAPELLHILTNGSEHFLNSRNVDYTYIFEIMYPGNRIVLDYDGTYNLVPLACRHRDTGGEVNLIPSMPGADKDPYFLNRTSKQDAKRITDWWMLVDMVNTYEDIEGCVVKFFSEGGYKRFGYEYCPNVRRIKFKTKWYFKHSRIKQYFEGKNVVRHLMELENADPDTFPQKVTEHLKYLALPPLQDWVHSLHGMVCQMASNIKLIHKTRAEQAKVIKELPVHPRIQSALFCSLDYKDDKLRELVWKSFEGEEDDYEAAYNRNMAGLELSQILESSQFKTNKRNMTKSEKTLANLQMRLKELEEKRDKAYIEWIDAIEKCDDMEKKVLTLIPAPPRKGYLWINETLQSVTPTQESDSVDRVGECKIRQLPELLGLPLDVEYLFYQIVNGFPRLADKHQIVYLYPSHLTIQAERLKCYKITKEKVILE